LKPGPSFGTRTLKAKDTARNGDKANNSADGDRFRAMWTKEVAKSSHWALNATIRRIPNPEYVKQLLLRQH
jgi:hypothetical protein